MSKFNPKNREEAFVYQLEDDIAILRSFSLLNKESFKKHLVLIQARIDAYNDAGLQQMCENAENKYKEKKLNFPWIED